MTTLERAGVCTLDCPDTCSLSVTVEDGRITRVHGSHANPLTEGVKMGTTLVGSVETVVKGIEHLQRQSGGGFGGLLFRAHEWATREQTLRSYELFARYVMPRFQGSIDATRGSNDSPIMTQKIASEPKPQARSTVANAIWRMCSIPAPRIRSTGQTSLAQGVASTLAFESVLDCTVRA